MQPSTTLRAVHKPLIHFLGPRASLWKDAPHHTGPHPLTPANLVKHVAKASTPATPPKAASATAASPKATVGALEFSQLAARYRRAPISEAEMEAIESGGATYII
ncbi:uncharacterized protein EV154DRAFT_509180 [Mucor mucedo]|uniref:uncharacterized protein n=1 Tax=Mucor mucedo TaxID=29922 RepID=UPI00221FABD7|nr:uncharacterized protein EV154DRAFT_509180 [Mucor mucedo]KAI7891104.1 hypothetical protein EV154DRAFT_509180 [Mucor mucedo]